MAQDLYLSAAEKEVPGTIKKLPLMVINSSVEATCRYLSTVREGSLAANVEAILHELLLLSQTLAASLLPRYRPHYPVGRTDSAFRLLEYFEAHVVRGTIDALVARHPTHSIVWLHDGFLISPPPTDETLRQVEAEVLSGQHLFLNEPWFKVTTMRDGYEERRDRLREVASAPLMSLSRRKPLVKLERVATMQGRTQIPMSPLEALTKLRARREKRGSQT